MSAGRRATVTAALICLLGGLILLGAGVADWVTETVERDLELAVVDEEVTTPATAFAPALLPLGLAVVILGAPLLGLARGRVRPLAVGVAGLLGLASVGVVVAGIAGAVQADGDTTAGPWAALIGALGVLGAAAVAAVGGVGDPEEAALSSRYDIDTGGAGVTDDPEDEWHLASDEDGPGSIEGRVEEDR